MTLKVQRSGRKMPCGGRLLDQRGCNRLPNCEDWKRIDSGVGGGNKGVPPLHVEAGRSVSNVGRIKRKKGREMVGEGCISMTSAVVFEGTENFGRKKVNGERDQYPSAWFMVIGACMGWWWWLRPCVWRLLDPWTLMLYIPRTLKTLGRKYRRHPLYSNTLYDTQSSYSTP